MSCPSLCVTLHLCVKGRVDYRGTSVLKKNPVCVCSVGGDCANGISSNKRLCWWRGTVNGLNYRAELTGLAQPLWARLSLRLHGFMLPNTQMDSKGGGWGEKKWGESVERPCRGENGKIDARRLAMWGINVKIRRKKNEAERKKIRMLPCQLQFILDQSETSTSSFASMLSNQTLASHLILLSHKCIVSEASLSLERKHSI